ncbi:hypothetical protein M885DRAFT_574859 [Pelagophyceae sp. CCMP2097]|nr:hypothetical protein M885DRAFT_574859 [Pelagophyceae sp. CCMP2097]
MLLLTGTDLPRACGAVFVKGTVTYRNSDRRRLAAIVATDYDSVWAAALANVAGVNVSTLVGNLKDYATTDGGFSMAYTIEAPKYPLAQAMRDKIEAATTSTMDDAVEAAVTVLSLGGPGLDADLFSGVSTAAIGEAAVSTEEEEEDTVDGARTPARAAAALATAFAVALAL